MGLVNKVVPLEQLEDEYVQWAEEMMLLSPLALRRRHPRSPVRGGAAAGASLR